MRKKIDDGGFETPYRLRKQVVEPVFGQIKQARGFRQFLLHPGVIIRIDALERNNENGGGCVGVRRARSTAVRKSR
jgi:hypothetical protein